MPVGQGHGVGQQPGVAVRQQRPHLAQGRGPHAVPAGRAGPRGRAGPVGRQRGADSEVDGAVGVLAEEEAGAGGRLLGGYEDQFDVALDEGLAVVDD